MLAWLNRQITRILPQRPDAPGWQRHYIGAAGIALVLAGLLTLAWHLTLAYRLPQYEHVAGIAAAAEARQTELRERIARLESRIATLETEVTVVRGANRQLMRTEDQRQQDLASLRAEVDFYQRLAQAGGRQAGLAVHSVEVIPGFSPRRWRFSVALIQRLQRAETTTGRLRVQLEGLRGDQPVTLGWDRLRVSGEPEELTYAFKYFAQVRGRLLLPPDFRPRQFTVILEPDDEDTDGVRRSFPWPDVTEAEGPLASPAR